MEIGDVLVQIEYSYGTQLLAGPAPYKVVKEIADDGEFIGKVIGFWHIKKLKPCK